MARLTHIHTVLPPHRVDQEQVVAALEAFLGPDNPDLATARAFIEGSRIAARHLAIPIEEVLRLGTCAQRNDRYIAEVVSLGGQAVEGVLREASMDPAAVDLLVTVSCTGVMIPSLDAHLIQILGINPQVRRLPITELGCSGGLAGLAAARDFCSCRPGSKALVVATELCSLNFQPEDASITNLVSTALFGDGAAAALIQEGGSGPGLDLLEGASFTFPDSLRFMGFDLRETGFHVVLDRAVPEAVGERLLPLVSGLLDAHGWRREEVEFWAFHPGGKRVIEAIEGALGLDLDATRLSWQVLERYGNMSSATLLFVLHELLQESNLPRPGARGLLGAFGPGFTGEVMLARWAGLEGAADSGSLGDRGDQDQGEGWGDGEGVSR